MATIIMRTDLLQSPKVMRLSARCKCSPILIMGGLYWLWATAQSHSRDGLLSALDAESIDHTTGIPSFSESLQSVGWITITPDGVQIEEFERYFGESAKIREQNRLRAARHRQREASGERNAPSVTDNVTHHGKTRDGVSDVLHGTERNGTQRNENGTEPNSTSLAAAPVRGQVGDKSGTSTGPVGEPKQPPAIAPRARPPIVWPVPPQPIDTPAVRAALAEWREHRADIQRRKRSAEWTPRMEAMALRQWNAHHWTPERVIETINHTIAGGWVGFVEPGSNGFGGNGTTKPDHRAEKRAREYAEPDNAVDLIRRLVPRNT